MDTFGQTIVWNVRISAFTEKGTGQKKMSPGFIVLLGVFKAYIDFSKKGMC